MLIYICPSKLQKMFVVACSSCLVAQKRGVYSSLHRSFVELFALRYEDFASSLRNYQIKHWSVPQWHALANSTLLA